MNKKDFEGIATFILLLLGATAIIKIIDEANKSARYLHHAYWVYRYNIVDLPQKNGVVFPLFGYEKSVFDTG